MNIQTVKQWRMESPPMPGNAGAWPIKEIVRWRIAKVKTTDVRDATLRQKFELGEIELERKRMELKTQQAGLIDRAEVELWAAEVVINAREAFLGVADTLATFATPETREHIRAEATRTIRDILTTLGRELTIENMQSSDEGEEV